MTTRVVRVCYAAWILVLTAIYYAFPGSHLYTWALIGYSGAAAVLLGVRLNRPERRLPWYLISAALVCFTTGDNVYNLILAMGRQPSFPGTADVLYLLVYPLLTGGFLGLVRARDNGASNRAALLDALVPTVGLGLLAWVYWIAPFTRSDSLSLLQKLVSVGYPLGDVLVLAMMLRMLTSPGKQPRALPAIGVAMVGLLVSDICYGQSQLDSAWQLGGPVDLGWVIFYATMGFAALLPSMRGLTEPAPRHGAGTGPQRIIWMACAALIAPGVLYTEYATGEHTNIDLSAIVGGVQDAPVIAAAAALMFLLVLLRVYGLAGEINRRDSEAYFRTLIQNASDVILIVAGDDRIRYASPAAATVFGHPDLAGTPLGALVAVGAHPDLAALLARLRATQGGTDGAGLAVACADGRLVQVDCVARDLRDDHTVRGLVLTLHDVTEQRRLEQDLSHQAFHDGLTGLANRVLFRTRLETAFQLAGRVDGELAVLFVDVDDFKEVNDALGHAVGDQLLVVVGARIAEVVGTAGTAARMGGDEFAVLLEQDAAARPEELAARIVGALAVPIELGDGLGGTHIVSGASSVGVAINGDATSATELLRHADLALYQAKDQDKGTWQPYRSELHSAMAERLETRLALHEAIDGQQFAVQYQPIVDVETGQITGVESLVRWQHPTRGLLGPYHFIDLAEESGAIVAIGSWVLGEALEQFARWRSGDPDSPLRYVSVNVSARQFRTPGFVDLVRAALADAGARPEWLLLEITESLLLRDAEQVWADLRTLRSLGVRIAIDDFGTGYSSLSYLRQMPVDVIKLDKSFIDDILVSDQQRALVDAIVTLARILELAVVAEGIEEPAQRSALAGMGCPYGQGYLFSKPVWPDEIVRLAREVPQLV